ncbi:hypothetical protein H0X06_01150 [Candidatus Dependentiae bacterium]|nr:hypothetical protein [Candidatus Dependentiae bacterium]
MIRITASLFYLFLLVSFSRSYSRGPTPTYEPSTTVDFFSSMGWYIHSNNRKKKKYFSKDTHRANYSLKRIHALKALYDRNSFAHKKIQGKPVIPKIIHHIWLGPLTPPAVFKESQKSIKKYHPEWEYKLWTDADIPKLKLYNQKFYDLSKNYGEKADIVRYEILYTYGGIYLDVDFICLKPLDILLQYDLWASIQPIDCRGDIANGIIGSIPGHPILQDCIYTLEDDWYTFNKETSCPIKAAKASVFDKVGPRHFQKSFMKFVNEEAKNIIAFPTSFFYPVDFRNRLVMVKTPTTGRTEKIQSYIKPETFAIHYWAGSWWDATVK